MPQFAANLSFLYNEFAFPDRFEAAAKDGFRAVEYLFPYEYAPGELRARLDANGLKQVLFNAPPGDWAQGERGTAALPGRQEAFRRGIDQALEYALALGCKSVHVLAGLVPEGADSAAYEAAYLRNLDDAARSALAHGVTLMIEPINTRDIPGYFLNRQDQAHA